MAVQRPQSSTGEEADRRLTKRNFWAHAIEGGAFMGAMGFLNANTVMPVMVQNLGGPDWLVALSSSLMGLGFLLPPIFIAHALERLHRFHSITKVSGVFQRLPYLAAALALWWAGPGPIALLAVVMAPFLSGLYGGITATAWQQLVVRTVPTERRSSLFAMRFILASLIGLWAGVVVKYELAANPGAAGYAWLHLYAFIGLSVSFAIFCAIREPAAPVTQHEETGLVENLRSLPALIRGDRRLILYLVTTFAANGILIVSAFLAIHAQRVVGQGESYVGDLLVAQMAGAIIGNLLAGWLGDRHGGKAVMLLARLLFLVLTGWAAVATSDLAFRAIFFLFGFAAFANQVGTSTLALEILPERRRSTFLAVISAAQVPGVLLAAWISSAVWQAGVSFSVLSIIALACLAVSLVSLLRLDEPRQSVQGAIST
jgi:MFS family permease